MGLRIKSLSEILGDMVTWISTNSKKITDFNVGSATRTLLEAVALQIEEFYYKMYENVMWAIENSIFNAFGFQLKAAKASTGFVTVYFSFPMPQTYTVKAGFKVSTGAVSGRSVTFSVTKDVIVPIGALEIMLPVQCDTAGEIGNVPPNSINYMLTPITSVKGLTNAAAFINGLNAETRAERKQRFVLYIQTLARGTVSAIAYGCLEIDGVKGVWIDDSKAGLVSAYVHDINGELPDELKQAVLKNLEKYRAGGVEVEVLSVLSHPIDMKFKFAIQDIFDPETYGVVFKDAIVSHLNTFQVSQNLYISELISYMKTLYDDVIVTLKTDILNDVTVNQRQLIRAGDISVSVINIKNWSEWDEF